MREYERWGTKHAFWVSLEGGNASAFPVEVDLRFERHSYDEDDWFWTTQELEEGWGMLQLQYQNRSTYYGD
jgi:hypothetical protein